MDARAKHAVISLRFIVNMATMLMVLSGSTLALAPRDAEGSAKRTPPSFVKRAGNTLTLDGRPYRFTGLNVYNANSRYNCWYPLQDGDSLDRSLKEIGSGRVIRAWFFQHLATTDGVRDWTTFDKTLAVARRNGVRVIPVLGDQWGGGCEGWGDAPGGYKTAAWYASDYRSVAGSAPGLPQSYRDFVAAVTRRYRDDPTILAWQLMNEAEAKTGGRDGECPIDAAEVLTTWATDMARLVKRVDPNHLLSVGTMGGGQCGTSGDEYKLLHAIPEVDLAEYHDYSLEAMPGDEWNGLAVRLRQAQELGKPLFIGEAGIRPEHLDGTLQARAHLFHAKMEAQFAAGISGHLMWAWRNTEYGGSSLNDFDIGPNDPALTLLDGYASAPAPTAR